MGKYVEKGIGMGLYSRIIDLQKLRQAWTKVRMKKTSPGIDGITVDLFEAELNVNLKQLNLELKEMRYEPSPVRMVTLAKDGKERQIGLFCLRDKIVQQSIVQELHKLFDHSFASESCAFRSNRSALEAVSQIEKVVQSYKEKDGFVVKTDIHHFFEEIDHEIMMDILKDRIKEPETLGLIRQFLETSSLSEDGEIRKRERGICQGSSIAPILSNIYLNAFDYQVRDQADRYWRYADDILGICSSEAQAQKWMNTIETQLAERKLTINQEKTVCRNLSEGFSYLGYQFSIEGKRIPAKKENALREKLEELWTQNFSFEEKIKKGQEILNGWKQYFQEKRKIESIYELTVETAGSQIHAVLGGQIQGTAAEQMLQTLYQVRSQFINTDWDITIFFSDIWKKSGMPEAELFEYEQLWKLDKLDQQTGKQLNHSTKEELLKQYRLAMIHPDEEILLEILQIYSDCKCYNKAGVLQEQMKHLNRLKHYPELSASSENEIVNANDYDYSMDENELEQYYQLFVGREDLYASDTVNEFGKRKCETVFEPLTMERIQEMICNKKALATYVQRNNSTIHYLVLDIDISKKILLQYPAGTAEFQSWLERCRQFTWQIRKLLLKMGLDSLAEFSGFRGYHLWIFFQEWISVTNIHPLTECILSQIEKTIPQEIRQDLNVEVFPNKTRVTAQKFGQCIKLPFSRHVRTGIRSYFLNENGIPYEKQADALKEAVTYPLSSIRKIAGAVRTSAASGTARIDHGMSTDEKNRNNIPIEENYPNLKPVVKAVLDNCSLMQYLCRKAVTTSYLTHFERQSVVYVFGHLGEDGKEFVHQVMEHMLNYQYSTTDKFINKLPERPISCIKLREQYSQITAAIGCNCKFHRTKNCYPSPVLHAVKDKGETFTDVTLPLSRNVSANKEKQVFEEINVHKKVQELADKLVTVKKQRRALDKNILKIEGELADIFNREKIDCMEIEAGLLVRRMRDGHYEWVIEL